MAKLKDLIIKFGEKEYIRRKRFRYKIIASFY